VEEHLLFYARLKGMDAQHEKAAVDAAISNVSLSPFRNRLSKGLSGGEKRRLSIAIALVGNPGVIFLDEPTVSTIVFFVVALSDVLPSFLQHVLVN